MKKIIIVCFIICVILGAKLIWFIFRPEPVFQSQVEVYLSMYAPLSEHTDLKSAQITHMDGTPVKVVLAAFSYNPLGTTQGYVEPVRGELYLGYRNPNNATPTIEHTVLLHELFHKSDLYHELQKYCKLKATSQTLYSKCAENKAYDFTHLYTQMLDLEKRGWLIINR